MVKLVSQMYKIAYLYESLNYITLHNNELAKKMWAGTFELQALIKVAIEKMVIDVNVKNTIRRKLKMRPYNSVQMSSLWIQRYVFSVISVYKDKDMKKRDLECTARK